MDFGGINTNQSFSLQLHNLSGVKAEIQLFELGEEGNGKVSVPTLQNSKTINNINANGCFEISPEARANTRLNEDIVVRVATLTCTFQDTLGNTEIFEADAGDNLSAFNKKANKALDESSHSLLVNTKFQLYVNQEVAVFDNDRMWLNAISFSPSENGDLTEGKTISSITLDYGTGITIYDFDVAEVKQKYITKSFIEIIDRGVVPYSQIQESQNGNVYDVRGMTLDMMKSPNQSITDNQMQECMAWDKKNANGNDMTYYKCPVRDMWARQNTYGDLEMGNGTDKFTLDGMTKFTYNLEGQVKMKLAYNYIDLPNLMLDDRYMKDYIKLQKDSLEAFQENTNFRRDVKLVVDEEIKDQQDKEDRQEPILESVEKTPIKKKSKKFNLVYQKMYGYLEGWYYSLCY